MKLLTFRKRDERSVRVGALSSGGEVVDLSAVYASYLFERGEPNPILFTNAYIPLDMTEFISGGQLSLKAAETALAYAENKKAKGSTLGIYAQEEIEFLPPISRPSKMIFAGRNYHEHVAEHSSSVVPEMPVAFIKLASSLVGHNGELLWTKNNTTMDYEIELAFIIGKKGKYIERDEAIEYIYGYTICNDVSERVLQFTEKKHGNLIGGKNMDTFAPMGPWIVTKDEIKDPHNLNLTLRVNGEIRQNSNTKMMIYNIFDQIAHWSSMMTLQPGDIISTGTPEGVALGRKPSEAYYLKPGDVIEAEIEGLGVLVNKVVKEEEK